MSQTNTKEASSQLEDGLDQALMSFIENAGKISANMLGMVNKVGGQIYALLFMSRSPLSLDEIAEKLEISKGNVSVNVRLLEDLKLVKKIWVKGSRRDFYEARRDFPKKLLKGFFDRIREGIEDSMRLINRCHHQLEESLDQDTKESEISQDAKFMRDQLAILKMFYSAASHFFEDFYQGRPVDSELLRRVVLD